MSHLTVGFSKYQREIVPVEMIPVTMSHLKTGFSKYQIQFVPVVKYTVIQCHPSQQALASTRNTLFKYDNHNLIIKEQMCLVMYR